MSIFLVLVATLLASLGALVIKKATNRYTIKKLFFSSLTWKGFFLYGLSLLIYIVALREERLTLLYPLVSTTYLWTTLLSVKYLKERMNFWKWFGLTGIMLGIVLIGFGS